MTSESKKALDQAQLMQAIGHIVVACGHLELQLRRALVWLRGLPPGSITPVRRLGWSVMIDEIRQCEGTSGDAAELVALLDKHQIERLKKIRDNIIHGCIWMDHAPNLYAARHPSRDRSTVVLADLRDLHAAAPAFYELARSVDRIVPAEGWVRARVDRPDWAEDGAPAPPAGTRAGGAGALIS